MNILFLKKIKSEIDAFEHARQQIIHMSSDNLKLAKKTIFEIHRDNLNLAKENIDILEEKFATIEKDYIKKIPSLRYEGAYKASIEEYAEAKIFYEYIANNKLTPIKNVNIFYGEYIGGLCDFTGELLRKATLHAIKGNYDQVDKFYNIIKEIMSEIIEYNLSSYLRTKADQMKRNMKKMEEIMYDISIKLRK